MLICTNDGFTGSNSLPLPTAVGETATYYAAGYDAGSEVNTEDFDDLVPPCGPLTGVNSFGKGTKASNPALAENGVVRHHPGIIGGADLLTVVRGWSDPIARITVTRLP